MRGCPSLDAQRWSEVGQPQAGLVAGQVGQGEALGSMSSVPQLLLWDVILAGDGGDYLGELRRRGLPLAPRDLRTPRRAGDHALHLSAEGIAAEVDLRHQQLPGPVSGPLARRHEFPVAAPGLPSGRELGQEPIDFKPDGRPRETGSRPIAAPSPFHGRPGHAGADRVEDHIASQLQKVALPLDEDGLEPALEEVPDPAVTPIEALRVRAVELPHAARERGLRGLEEQVVVVAHHYVGVHAPAKDLDDPAESPEESLSVLVIPEDVAPLITATRDVPDRPRVIETKRPSHANSHYHRPDPNSFFYRDVYVLPASVTFRVAVAP